MKKIAIALLLLFLFGSSRAEWKIRNAFTGQLDLFDIHVDGDRIYAVGYVNPSGGVFMSIHLESNDGGATWTKTTTEGEFHKAIVKKDDWQMAGFTPTGKSLIKTQRRRWSHLERNFYQRRLLRIDRYFLPDRSNRFCFWLRCRAIQFGQYF